MNSKNANHLIRESSPYLLQHAYNPVDWYPWNENSLRKAKTENKLLIISIGYSACHWCHVMEKESFEDQEVARIMNDHFVSIKVDREERPDIDQVYMQASYAIHGNGGWPLNIIALPDGKPVYAGTYFPKEKWKQVLSYFTELRDSQSDLLSRQADEVTANMQKQINLAFAEDQKIFSQEDEAIIVKRIIERIDLDRGGLLGAPKFPMPVVFEFLLYYYSLHPEENILDAVTVSLENMAAGGIYDQLGGGFFRYSTDDKWLVPHFEKMLYDNAQLISLYAHAYQLNQSPVYEKVIRETISFVSEKLGNGEGAYYCALDADSEGQEGKYYVWTKKQLETVLGEEAAFFNAQFNISEQGNWENDLNILHMEPGKMNETIEQQSLAAQKQKLLSVRERRISPGLDDKVLTSWNALMLLALTDAYRALGDEKYLDMALKNARFLESRMINEDYSLNRNFIQGKAFINAFLDDYAFLISAFIALYQVTFDENWLRLSRNLAKYAISHFYEAEKSRFHYNSSIDPDLIIRPSETDDNVIPSSISVMLSNISMLQHYFPESDFIVSSEKILSSMAVTTRKSPVFHANWAKNLISSLYPQLEIGIIGKDADMMRNALQKNFLPGIAFYGGKKRGTLSNFQYKYIEGKTLIYVCADKSCYAGVEKAGQALALINEVKQGAKA
jgi:hypothetical protein